MTISTKETGNKRDGRAGIKLTVCRILCILALSDIVLCGCTHREQLVLESVSADREEGLTDRQKMKEPDESEQQNLQEQSIPEQGALQQEELFGNGELRTIYVHVCGAVAKPDVYELPAGSRVYDAVEAAGGFTEEADESYVNQAQKLADGVKLVIPTLAQTEDMATEAGGEGMIGIVGEQPSSSDESNNVNTASDGKININIASEAELCNIPGIGAVRAAAIVAYRQEKGGFSSIEDIKNVSGIKEGTYEKIKDSITIN